MTTAEQERARAIARLETLAHSFENLAKLNEEADSERNVDHAILHEWLEGKVHAYQLCAQAVRSQIENTLRG